MKIGLVGAPFAPGKTGGTETLFRTLVASLNSYETGNEYLLYVWPQYVDHFQGLGPSFTVVPLGESWGLWDRARRKLFGAHDLTLRRLLASQAVDLLHFPFTSIYPMGLPQQKVLTFCDMQQELLPAFFSSAELNHRKRTYRASVDEADHVIAISNYTKRTLIEYYEVPPEKVTTVYPTYDERLFAGPRDREWPWLAPYFFYPAACWPHKNHRRLLVAFRGVVDQYPKARLRLTGKIIPSADASVRREIAELGLGANVEFLGYVPYEDLPALYQDAVALVFPSLFEGFGIPLLEAMAMGCPIACSNTTSLPEVGGDAAVYFNPRNEEEIGKTMLRLLADGSLRNALSSAGVERVRKFSADRMAHGTVQAYAAVSSSGPSVGRAPSR